MLPAARKTVSKKTFYEKNFWIKIASSRLSYALGLHGEKKIQGKFQDIMKNKDDTFHTQ